MKKIKKDFISRSQFSKGMKEPYIPGLKFKNDL